MKRTTSLVLTLAAAAVIVSSAPISSHAGDRERARPRTQQQAAATSPTQKSWWGMGARVGCRLGISRGQYTLITYGFCLLAFVDAVT